MSKQLVCFNVAKHLTPEAHSKSAIIMNIYNFQQLKQEGKLTEQQFNLLSWLAYAEYSYQVYKEPKFYHYSLAYDNALRVLKVPDEVIFAVKQGNIKGLQNYNRIASTEYFNHNIGYCSNI